MLREATTPTYKRFEVGPIPRFDQKYDMFKRARWDPEMVPHGNRFYSSQAPLPKEGYELQDIALRSASWLLERGFAHGNYAGDSGLFSWECNDPIVAKMIEPIKEVVDDPGLMSKRIKVVARYFGASLVGICELDRRWLYSYSYHPVTKEHELVEIPEEIRFAIALGIEMEYDLVKTSPSCIAGAATGLGYSRMAFAAGLLAQFIRFLGYRAIPSGNDTALSIPIAVDAGLGELGRHGLLISREYGPRLRLCKVLTDLPLVPDRPVDLGVQRFCEECQVCAEKCPANAIRRGERTAEPNSISNNTGVAKWPLKAENCFKFWAANRVDCLTCIRVCPFNKERGRIHDLSRFLIRKAPWMNRLLIRLDQLLGYEDQKRPGFFWNGRDGPWEENRV